MRIDFSAPFVEDGTEVGGCFHRPLPRLEKLVDRVGQHGKYICDGYIR